MNISAAVALILACIAPTSSANPVNFSIDYSSRVGAAIRFDGQSHFSFTPATNNIQVTSAGPAVGLLGEMSGTYTIGNITTSAGISSAQVSGVGVLTIHDGLGYDLTGQLRWVDIVQAGTGDFLNTAGAVNLTNIDYAGSNSLLLALSSAPNTAVDALSFQFTPAKPLSKLKTVAANTSFSGVITATREAPDGGSVLVLLGVALAAVALVNRLTLISPAAARRN